LSAVRLAFTWLGVRKTLAREQRTTAATAFQADRELLSATKLILDTKHPSFRNVARVRSEASGYWRTETLPFPEPGVRLLPQNKLAGFDARMSQFRQELVVGTDGDVRCVYDEGLDRRALGKLQITRASHVEPDSDGNRWADMGPVGGPVLGPFGTRGEALQAERGWLRREADHREPRSKSRRQENRWRDVEELGESNHVAFGHLSFAGQNRREC